MVLWDLWLSLLVAWMYRPLGLSIIVDCCTCDSSVFGRLLCFFRPHFIATFLTSCPLHYTHVKSWASMSAWYSVQFLLPQLSNIFNLANRVPIVLNRGLTINWKKPICILAIFHWLSSPFMYEVTGNFSCCSFSACLVNSMATWMAQSDATWKEKLTGYEISAEWRSNLPMKRRCCGSFQLKYVFGVGWEQSESMSDASKIEVDS